MSSRSLRKAQRDKGIDHLASIDDDCLPEYKPKTGNLFSQFSHISDEPESDTEESASSSSSSSSEDKEPVAIVKNNKHKKISKKSSRKINSQLDEIDVLFEKHFENDGSNTAAIVGNNEFNDALSINPSWVDYNFELKKKFGSAVSGGSSVLGDINSRALRQNPALSRALKFKRKNGLITPRPLWPPFSPSETGLSVQLVQKTVDFDEYRIIENAEYSQIFEELEILVRTGDIEFLIQLIQTQPLFVDGLLLLSDAYRMQSTGDAGELVERSLYILERILPTELSFLSGRCRFRYSYPENRKLHLCLFRQIQFTMKMGCWRVSLQLAKTLLALDPESDPLGARLFIDFLSLQSESFEDFDKLWIQIMRNCHTGHFPGWYFNKALRLFIDEEKTKTDHLSSTEALVEALNSSPGTGRLLLLSLKSKMSGKIPLCQNFESDSAQIGAATIFVSRCNSLWKPQNVLKWLENVVSLWTQMPCDLLNFESFDLYHQVPIYRHSLLSDLPSLNISIPNQVSSISSLNSYDPLPPECFEDEGNGKTLSIIDGLRGLLLGSLGRAN